MQFVPLFSYYTPLIKLVMYNNSTSVFVLNQGTVALTQKNKQM